MRWEWPFMLLLLLAIPALLWWGRRPLGRRPAVLWVRTGSWGGGSRAWLLRAVDVLPWLALALALVSLGRPQQGLRQSEVETRGVDIMLAIDISPSMGAEDFRPRNRLFVAKETAAEAVTALGSYISLHTGDPGSTGANEAVGGAPAYARKQTTWETGDAIDGVQNGSQVTIDLSAGTYTHFGLWSAESGGTFIGGGAITSTTLGAQGQIKVTPTYTQS